MGGGTPVFMRTAAALDLITRHEGFRPVVYCDRCGAALLAIPKAESWSCNCRDGLLGNLTVGIGQRVDGPGVRLDQARAMLDCRVGDVVAELDLLPWFARLDGPRQVAIVDMAFQMGVEGVKEFRQTIAHLEAQDWGGAADAMLQSDWANQTPTRAAEDAHIIRTGSFAGEQADAS